MLGTNAIRGSIEIPYIHFTEDQKLRASEVDLEQFLLRQGEKLLTSGHEKRLASDHSVTIRGNHWYDHAEETGGGPISFVRKFYGLSYPEAVLRLLGGEQGEAFEPVQRSSPREKKEFALPPHSPTMRRMYAYLLKQRCIRREVVDAFVHAKLLYESAELSADGSKEYHNAVFVGLDEHGVARHAHKRGLYTLGGGYKRTAAGCDRYILKDGRSTVMLRSAAPLNTPCFGCWSETKISSKSRSAWTTMRLGSKQLDASLRCCRRRDMTRWECFCRRVKIGIMTWLHSKHKHQISV